MPITRPRKSRSLAGRSADLALSVPQVVAHRLTRMAAAGTVLSARDRREFERMFAEKNAAFAESWRAMTVEAMRANQALVTSMFRSFWSASLRGKPPRKNVAAQVRHAALGVLNKGLAPVHQKAVANARRLAKTRLR